MGVANIDTCMHIVNRYTAETCLDTASIATETH